MSRLCVQKVIYSEWSSGRRDLRGGYAISAGRAAGEGEGVKAMGLLMYSTLTFMESDLKKRALIQTRRQMESHVNRVPRKEHENAHCLVAHMHTPSARMECAYT